jgi:hypothetical protein
MVTAIIDFRRIGFGRFQAKASVIHKCMKGNLNFPTTIELVEILGVQLKVYTDAMAKATYGTPAQKALRNTARNELFGTMCTLCKFINYTARGNISMLYTSGYTLSGDGKGIIKMEPLKHLKVMSGKIHGSIIVKAKKGYGAFSMLVEYTQGETIDKSSKWSITMNGRSFTVTISNLTPGQWVWVRVTCLGRREQRITSDPVRMVVQ